MMEYVFATGSYATEKEHGIQILKMDGNTGEIQPISQASGIQDPTWIAYDADRCLLYTGGLADGNGAVAAYCLQDDLKLQLLKILPVSGGASCHQALDGNREFMSVSFYGTGSLSIVRLDEDGLPAEECCHIIHNGHSVHPKRQQESHIHFSQFIGDTLYCCDLGEDRVYEYALDRRTGQLTETDQKIMTNPGEGPRHFVYDPKTDLLYVATEMGASVDVFERSSGQMVQRIASIPEDRNLSELPVIDYDAFGAAIHEVQVADSCRILVSNRGDDSISIFTKQEDGRLQRIFNGLCGGRIPRDFAVMGQYIVTANQTSDDLSVLKLNTDNTTFTNTGIRCSIGAPTRVLPLQVEMNSIRMA